MDTRKSARIVLAAGTSSMVLGLLGIPFFINAIYQNTKINESAGIGAVGGLGSLIGLVGLGALLLGILLAAAAGVMLYKAKNRFK